ncbi:hypothetical protein M8C21_031575 [Ambrosia artemisiifolia]|uniref:Uncharacterized protein n=1 Tax=Ambrosia artemisiifolia TaxID=4212 RepID=A0AAD5BP90_AMBAR|nr:hypothetical protein M8C21_031575 [Ambrosia artemisiifolia]
MASSGKFDFSSSSPSRQLYTSGKRGSHTAASMDRSASFRDTMENPILSSLPSMSRSSINVSQGDVTSFLQCLRFDLKSMAAEYKCNRYGDFKRLANAALCAPDDSPSGLFKGKLTSYSPEDLKRLKVGLRESTIKARERVKIFSDVLSVINKCFPSIPSRKRSRPDAFSSGVTVGKMGTQSHTLTSAFDVEQQKVEERGKNVIPNKRTRTSLVDQRADVRPNTPARSSGSVDRDREISRLPNSNTLQGVDGMLPMVVDGWEKAKMKKKRTVIKADWAPSTSSVLAKPTDGSREPKQGMHPRSLADSRSRLNDPHEFRSGAANGSMRSSIPRPEQENTSVLHDKRDQTTKLAQERTNVGAFNKANARQDFMSGTPSSTTKPHAVAPGPRSGPSAVPKMTNVQSPTISNGSNPGLISSTNRKRGLSTRSSSPPVAQWADRRPQKISRTARRTNLIPVLSTNEEVPPLSNNNIIEKGRGFAKRIPTSSPKQFKSKGDSNIQSSTLSESEDSGAAEIRSRDSLKSEDIGDKDGLNVQKMSTLVLPTRRNKFMNEKHHRTGRGFARSVGKLGTEKQHRTSRVGFDKPESKVGRPPTRKLSGRQAYTRQKQSAFTAATDFLDDGHGELLAAANAVMNPVYALSNPFWKQMDPHFGFVSDASLTYLKQEMQLSLPQGNIRSTANFTNSIDDCDMENGTESGCEYSEKLTSGTSPRGITLCQRLLAALISEEDDDDELNYNVYGSAFEPETDLIGGSFSSSYMIDSTLRSCNEVASSAVATGFDHRCNGLLSDSGTIHTISSSRYQYGDKSMDERLLIEIHSLGLYPEHVPDLVHTGDEDINKDISRLEEKHHQQVLRKKSLLDKLLKSTEETMAIQEKEFERLSLEKLAGMAYQKYMSCWNKSTSSKMAKQAALDFVKRTLDRCHEFETTGISCFSEPLFKEIFHSGLSHQNHTEEDDVIDRHQSRKVNGANMEDFSGTQVSPMLNNHDMYPSEPATGKDDVWSSKGKRRELYLDDVAAGSPCTSSGTPSGVGRVIINSVKGKRSEREPRNGGPKVGRPAKIKAKQKQKTTELSAPVNGSLGNFSDQQRAKSSFVPKPSVNEEDESMLLEEEPLDLSHLQLPEMVDFGGQGEDIGSWLNIDDDILQHDDVDDDFMGLEIPMDDLTDLNMMV